MSGLVFGAYVAAPPGLADDAAARSQWYGRLSEEPLIGGLEIAWGRELVPEGAARLARDLRPGWASVVTMMAGVAARLKEDPRYGLASRAEDARRLAVADVVAAHREIAELRSALGPGAVLAVEIQSAPGADAASPVAFAASLRDILELDWAGVHVVVEHCDGADGVRPAKAFLPLALEMACLEEALTPDTGPAGHAVNWARSVIERRSADGADQAITHLVAAERLTGLMFSGVSPVATAYGRDWADSHLPVADGGPGSEPTSLLTTARVARAVQLAGPDLLYLGAKIAAPKIPGLTIEQRLAPGLATLRAVAVGS